LLEIKNDEINSYLTDKIKSEATGYKGQNVIKDKRNGIIV